MQEILTKRSHVFEELIKIYDVLVDAKFFMECFITFSKRKRKTFFCEATKAHCEHFVTRIAKKS
jgi:hypothetical protein